MAARSRRSSSGESQPFQVMPEKLVFNRANTPVFIDNVLSCTFAFFLWPHVFQRDSLSAGELARETFGFDVSPNARRASIPTTALRGSIWIAWAVSRARSRI